MTPTQAKIEADKLISAHPVWSTLTGQRLYDKRHLLKNRLLNKCRYCGNQLDGKSSLRCSSCLKKKHKAEHIWKSQWRCKDCGKPRYETKIRCYDCLEKQRDRVNHKRETYRSNDKVCSHCGVIKHPEFSAGYKQCWVCREGTNRNR